MVHGFSRGVRLTTRAEFTRVQGKGRRLGMRHVTLFVLPNSLGHHRLGVVASRRIGGAVIRNSAKRRIREIFRGRHVQPAPEDGSHGFDVVVVARPGLAAAPFSAVQSELAGALAKLR